ncbi:unnamed protein product, partial [Symbiodinium microadriaticum]
AELLELSRRLPDETRIRESALEVEGQRSLTTGAYVHQDNVGLRRNLRNHRWTSELLARILAASFPAKPFSSLALFRDLKQPAHRDSTNGPWENLLLACTSFEGGGVWVQADEGPTRRQVLNKEMRGRVLEWKRGKITFDAHRWHSTEHWTGTRLVLAGYTIAGVENLGVEDRGLLRSRGFALDPTPGKPGSLRWTPPGLRFLEEKGRPEYAGNLGEASPSMMGRGWEDLRLKLDDILLEHAGGDAQLDRAPFEMEAKGELGCSLVSDPALHGKLIEAMVEHLQRKVFEPQTKWKLELGAMDVAQSWKANYESAEQNLDFVRELFEAEVGEGLMIRMDESDFWAKYGEEAAISAIAVIVEEGPPVKKRVVHDASHDVLLNHRIRCLDKVRSPGAREKRYLLRHLREERLAPVAITGDISK